MAGARRFAEELLSKCHTVTDFNNMAAKYDEGDSKARGGLGYGSRHSYIDKDGQRVYDIRPSEVEDYLFKLEEGQVGPIVEIATGVHIIRLLKHDEGGLQPFDEKLQLQIRDRLRRELADREVKRLTHELRGRAVIEYVPPEVP